jgi:cyclophilin family peptidyl-prolyl cis-trans isomerase
MRRTLVAPLVPLTLVALLLCVAPANASSRRVCASVPVPAAAEREGKRPAKLLPRKAKPTLTFTTNCGTFIVTLDVRLAPRTSASLVALARAKFFDGTLVHRIAPGFVIQGGDPTQTGGGGPGYSTVDVPPANTRYEKGTVAMAKTQLEPPGTSGSQWFIVTADDAELPPDYAVVGKVSAGLAVVERIGRLGTPDQRPTEPVVVTSVTVAGA